MGPLNDLLSDRHSPCSSSPQGTSRGPCPRGLFSVPPTPLPSRPRSSSEGLQGGIFTSSFLFRTSGVDGTEIGKARRLLRKEEGGDRGSWVSTRSCGLWIPEVSGDRPLPFTSSPLTMVEMTSEKKSYSCNFSPLFFPGELHLSRRSLIREEPRRTFSWSCSPAYSRAVKMLHVARRRASRRATQRRYHFWMRIAALIAATGNEGRKRRGGRAIAFCAWTDKGTASASAASGDHTPRCPHSAAGTRAPTGETEASRASRAATADVGVPVFSRSSPSLTAGRIRRRGPSPELPIYLLGAL